MNTTCQIYICSSQKDEKCVKEFISLLQEYLKVDILNPKITNHDQLETGIQAIENAKVIIPVLSKIASEDNFFFEALKFASNLNKTILPIIIDGRNAGSLKNGIKDITFRSKIFEYANEDDRESLIQQCHSILGLTSCGDLFGGQITFVTDRPCSIQIDEKYSLEANDNSPESITLRPGDYHIWFTDNSNAEGIWIEYIAHVLNKKQKLEIIPDFACHEDLYKGKGYNYRLEDIRRCTGDIEGQSLLQMGKSSLDEIKIGAIRGYYTKRYNAEYKPVPAEPRSYGIDLPEWLDGLVYTAAAALCFYPLWQLIVLIFWCLIYFLCMLCTFFIICFFSWNPCGEAWDNFTDAFSWTLVASLVIVGGYWALKLFLKGSYAASKKTAYLAKVAAVNQFNASLRQKLNSEMNSIFKKKGWPDRDLISL